MLKHIPFYGSLIGRDLGERKATAGHILVYGAIEAHSFGPKGCIASNTTIAEETGMEDGSVRNIISRLAKAGWIDVVLNSKRQRVSIIPLLSIVSPRDDTGCNPLVTRVSSLGEHREQLDSSTLTSTAARERRRTPGEIAAPPKNGGDLTKLLESVDVHLKIALEDFIADRKERKAPMTRRAVELAVAKLQRMYPGNTTMQIACINQSIANGWKGLFDVRGSDTPTNGYYSPERDDKPQRKLGER